MTVPETFHPDKIKIKNAAHQTESGINVNFKDKEIQERYFLLIPPIEFTSLPIKNTQKWIIWVFVEVYYSKLS